ncbi:MAG TPA: hypothetical protein PLZ57_04300 [Pseudobdellovibrionaceae bacterium]|nr:hypothetical protein [Pseudobdellovibrionaceae bacterium]
MKRQSKRIALMSALLMLGSLLYSSTLFAKKVQYRKVQDVNFDAAEVDGQVRNPDGAYVVQKRVTDFVPLYKVRRNFDENIKESVNYVK